MDHTITDQTSVLRFIEDNWLNRQRLGPGTFDRIAGSINNMFDFSHSGPEGRFELDPETGTQIL